MNTRFFYKVVMALMFSMGLISCKNNTDSHSHNGLISHVHDHEKVTSITTDYFGNYELEDSNYGTKTTVIVNDVNRTMVTNALPNHDTGSFPNQGNPNTISPQNMTYTFPVNPKYTGKAQWVRES